MSLTRCQIYRCYLIWHSNYYIIIFPIILYLGYMCKPQPLLLP